MNESADRGADSPQTGRVGVYTTSDERRTGGSTGLSGGDTVGVHDRPASADRSRMTPTVITVVAALVLAILLLIWIL